MIAEPYVSIFQKRRHTSDTWRRGPSDYAMTIRHLGWLVLILAIAPLGLRAQDPVLTGTVNVDPLGGRLEANLCLTSLPAVGGTMRFVLHRALNVKHIRSGSGEELEFTEEAEPEGRGIEYAVSFAGGAEVPPDTLCAEYMGAFPVYDVRAGDYRPSDGSSVVAFNGRTLRARGETRWYPTPYDATTGRTVEQLPYRLRVRCTTCDNLYVNGAPPLPGPEADFHSDRPREPLLLAGKYPVSEFRGVHFLGEAVAADTALLFLDRLRDVTDFYEDYIGVSFGDQPDIVRIIPVRHDRRGQFWGFFADPALGLVGLTVGDFVRILSEPEDPARALVLGVLAHELAHRYFPGHMDPGGAFFQLFSEPFATYLDLKATRHFHGEEAYRERVRALAERTMSGHELPGLDEAGPHVLLDDRYRYGYVPLLLLSMEEEVGEPRMRSFLRALIVAPASERDRADYAFMLRSARRAGISRAALERWAERCIRTSLHTNECLQRVVP